MITFVLLIVHFLADFTFQSKKVAEKKKYGYKYLGLHSFIYFCMVLIIGSLCVSVRRVWGGILVISISHALIDLGRATIDRKSNNKNFKFGLFLLDQILHISIIIFVSGMFNFPKYSTRLWNYCAQFGELKTILGYLLTFIILWDPVSILIKKLFQVFTEEDEDGSVQSGVNAGSLIGKMERMIIGILVLANQLGGIGFVLTAKSIARYKQLEDKDFAEKYLIGTLTSTSLAIAIAMLIKKIIL